MKIVALPQGEHRWKTWRAEGVTASDAIALVGADERTWWALYAEKAGLVAPPDLDRNPMVQRGHRREDGARAALEARLDQVLLPLCAEHEDYPFMRASFDGVDAYERPSELKAPGDAVAAEVAQYGTRAAAYNRYWYQLQHQLFVTGAAEGYLAFYNPDYFAGDGLVVFTIGRDAAFLDELLQQAQAFMRLLNGGVAPVKDPERDPWEPTRANAERWAAIARRYGELEARRKELKAEENLIRQEQAELAGDARDMMGAFKRAQGHGLRVTRSTRRGQLDTPRLLADYGFTEADVEPYRKAATETTTISVDFEALPEAPPAMTVDTAPSPPADAATGVSAGHEALASFADDDGYF